MKNRYLIYVALLILTLSITLGVTYSYLAAKINNRESSSTIKVESGQLSITYENNSGNIILNNIIPGDSVTKQFTLTGINNTKPNAITTNTDLKYKIGIVIDNNTFSEGALTYALTKDSSSSSNGKLANDATGTINSSGIQYIGKGYFVSGADNDKHIYNLTISFPDTNEDQSIDQGASFACHVTVKDNYVPKPKSFAEDSWETIAENTSSNVYNVGDTKQVLIGNKPYTVRIANKSTPSDCTREDFSQTACGFVVEFVDIVEKRNMNPSGTYKGIQYDYGWNVDGWPATTMRTYANRDFFNKLPSDLQSVIKDTKVISGHGSDDTANFISTDKIYLLSTHEVWEDVSSNNLLKTHDTAYNNTRQLDYYANLGVTTNDNSGAIKQYNSSNYNWWLRTAGSGANIYFWGVIDNGLSGDYFARSTNGFAPAFRIGENVNTVTPKSFAEDTWETIAATVKVNPAAYAVGSTKKLKVYDNPNGETTNGTYKEYTVRVANNTTPEECTTREDFSQTACGFVVEFVDIIEKRQMNSTNTNVGGWKDSAMRTYANGEFFDKLPSDLQAAITETKVISGHGSSESENLTTNDKIYLLAAKEINITNASDSAKDLTRVLDHYVNKVNSDRIKKYNNSNSIWWLRNAANAVQAVQYPFGVISAAGGYSIGIPTTTNGFVPVFRI